MKTKVKKHRFLDSEKTENILTLNSDEAIDFFLKSDQFHGFELPEYFNFDNVLHFVKEKIGNRQYDQCLANGTAPDTLADVNLDILLNKDGKYAVRPLILTNPYLYYFLVRELCSKKNWNAIKDCFDKYNVPHIKSCAIPVIPAPKEKFNKSTTILNWWNAMEQRSIELSLEYRYMFATDITNCYGSVNPQSIEWALNRKGTVHETPANTTIAHNIQQYLKAMQQGRNIGIPQGSTVFDFVSEIILGYADLLLHEQIQKHNIVEDYEILRYRDDYRILKRHTQDWDTFPIPHTTSCGCRISLTAATKLKGCHPTICDCADWLPETRPSTCGTTHGSSLNLRKTCQLNRPSIARG